MDEFNYIVVEYAFAREVAPLPPTAPSTPQRQHRQRPNTPNEHGSSLVPATDLTISIAKPSSPRRLSEHPGQPEERAAKRLLGQLTNQFWQQNTGDGCRWESECEVVEPQQEFGTKIAQSVCL